MHWVHADMWVLTADICDLARALQLMTRQRSAAALSGRAQYATDYRTPVVVQTRPLAAITTDRAVATACIYFRRFFVAHEFCAHDPRLVAPACLYLACKAEESQLQAKLLFYAMRKVAGEHIVLHDLFVWQRRSGWQHAQSAAGLSGHCASAEKYAGMPAMDTKQLTDMELLVLVTSFRYMTSIVVRHMLDHSFCMMIVANHCCNAGGFELQACNLPSLRRPCGLPPRRAADRHHPMRLARVLHTQAYSPLTSRPMVSTCTDSTDLR